MVLRVNGFVTTLPVGFLENAMHILTKRTWVDKALKDHQARFKETPDELVDRLLTGFFLMDAPWSKHGTWETPIMNGHPRPHPGPQE